MLSTGDLEMKEMHEVSGFKEITVYLRMKSEINHM